MRRAPAASRDGHSLVATLRHRLSAATVGAACAAWLLLASPSDVARADTTPAADDASTSTPDLIKGAEEIVARLRAVTRSLADADVFSALEAETSIITHQTTAQWQETERLLQGHQRSTALDSLESSWDAFRTDLDRVSRRIDARAAQRDDDLATLAALQTSWRRTLEVARNADAPPALLDRAQSALTMIDTTRAAVEQRRARLLVLQDAMSRAVQTSDDALGRIADVRRTAMEHVATPQQPPLWGSGPSLRPAPTAGLSVASDLAGEWESIRAYVSTYRAGIVLSSLVVLACVALLRRARRVTEAGRARGAAYGAAAAVLQTPYASAILLGLLLSRPMRPSPPFAFQQLMLALVTAATVLVLRAVVAPRLSRVIDGFAGLLLLNLTASVVQLPPRAEQLFLVIEMAAAAVLLLWGAAAFTSAESLGGGAPQMRKAGRTFARVVGLGCGVSAMAAAVGYLDLADFLGVGLFHSVFLALGLLALRITLDGLITVALARGPLAHLHTVARHRALIGRRTRRVLDVAAVAMWLWVVLGRFELLEPVAGGLSAVLDARLHAGELDLPFSRVLAFVVVVIGIVMVIRVVGTFLEEDVYSRMTLPRGVPYALSTLTRYGLLLVGFLLALATLGFDLTRITVLVSALGIGLGFGLQEVMNNFVSGLILLFERPVQVGDTIELGGVAGEIRRIGIRSSTVRTSQGAEIIVPNSKMIAEQVTNWTLSDRRRRIDLDVGVKGDADAERIIALLNEVVRQDARVSDAPPPEALLVRFGEDAMDFQVRVWTDEREWMRLRSDLSVALQRALRAARAEESGRS